MPLWFAVASKSRLLLILDQFYFCAGLYETICTLLDRSFVRSTGMAGSDSSTRKNLVSGYLVTGNRLGHTLG